MNMREQLIQQGEGALLIHLLEQKFTTLPKSFRLRIEQANTEMLLKWGVRVLDANAIDEVFY